MSLKQLECEILSKKTMSAKFNSFKVANCSSREAVFVLGARLVRAYMLAATWASPNLALTQP